MKTRIIGKEIIPPKRRMKVGKVSSEVWVRLGILGKNRKWWRWYCRHACFYVVLYGFKL